MKVKEELNLEILLNYGFTKIDKEEEKENDQYEIANFDWKFWIGHSRRGQSYYLLIGEETREIFFYSTKPDGDGGSVKYPDVLTKLFNDGVVY